MADLPISLAPPRRGIETENSSRRRLLFRVAIVGLVLGTAMYALLFLPAAAFTNFRIVFSSLLLQAIPLVMMGAVVAALVGTFVPDSAFSRLARLPEPLQIPVSALAGFAFPVCECGSVPVARRLIARGLVPSAAVTFMLAAPILNPIVVLSTSVAYRGRDIFWPMVLGRTGLGFLAAMVVGWIAGHGSNAGFLKPVASDDLSACGTHGSSCGCEDHEGCSHDSDTSRWKTFTNYLAGDFAFMGRFLVLGAAAAALLQTIVPQSVLTSVANTPVLSLLVMMALAFALSLCSESDAFVAASFVQFGVGPQLAFLVFGPMMDAKLAFLYRATFRKGFLKTAFVVITLITLVGTLWIEVIIG